MQNEFFKREGVKKWNIKVQKQLKQKDYCLENM